MAFVGWTSIAIWAFINTVISHAGSFTMLHGVFAVIISSIYYRKCKQFEAIGTYTIIIAVLIMIFDP